MTILFFFTYLTHGFIDKDSDDGHVQLIYTCTYKIICTRFEYFLEESATDTCMPFSVILYIHQFCGTKTWSAISLKPLFIRFPSKLTHNAQNVRNQIAACTADSKCYM